VNLSLELRLVLSVGFFLFSFAHIGALMLNFSLLSREQITSYRRKIAIFSPLVGIVLMFGLDVREQHSELVVYMEYYACAYGVVGTGIWLIPYINYPTFAAQSPLPTEPQSFKKESPLGAREAAPPHVIRHGQVNLFS
jgi:hypothetical protein